MSIISRVQAWVIALVVVTAASGASAQVFNPTTFTLDNGMQVVVIENHRAPIVSHMVWYKVGSADEPPGKSGIAHFLEHLMFKGTEAIAPGEFSKIVARNGGRDNAFTSLDYTAYFQNIAADRLELVMEMEADRMRNLTLDPEHVRNERQVVIEERLARTDNNPQALLHEQVSAALFMNHPYRIPVIGWASEIAGLTQQDAEAFYRTWYAPNNAILVVAGAVDPAEIRRLAETYYGPIEPGPVPDRTTTRAVEPPQVAERRVVLEDSKVEQPAWSRRYVAPSYRLGDTSQAYPLQILSEVLGGGATSRLYRTLVVEQALASGAGSWYDPASLDHGSFGIGATPRPGVTVETLEAGIDEVLRELLEKGVSADEVTRAKNRLRASVAYARDSLHTGARVLGEALTTGQSVEDVEAWPERIAAVTPGQVTAAARAVLEERSSVTGILLPAPKTAAAAPPTGERIP